MKHHAKASSAGSTQRQASGLGRIFRGASATRGASSDADGSGASSRKLGLATIALAACFLLIPVAQAAAANLVITFSGAGTGTVVSDPPGIECSNTPGSEKLSAANCGENFDAFQLVNLTATPDSPAIFGEWTGNTLDVFPTTCNSGSTNPCSFVSLIEAEVNATFEPPPPPPVATTGEVSDIGYYLATFEGKV
ncbi:MAG TPA: hypothetical protein VMR96_09830, partial [Solirubrobacterales bacterium]|nr:hypothetical protein [Solirubrobacterales bacterium]